MKVPGAEEAVTRSDLGADALDLYWIPLGADARVVRASGAVYERVAAALQGRAPQRLFHSALIARSGGVRHTIEMAPVPNRHGRLERGVVAEGDVGSRWLHRFRVFRYEVRCWADGEIPDLAHAVGGSIRITDDPDRISALLDLTGLVPTPVWGRDGLRAGDMWNSNSVTAWLLTSIECDTSALQPPHGRAPGWSAGIVAALSSGS